MPVVFDETNRVFKLDTPNTTYAMQVIRQGCLAHLYYGASVEDTDLGYLICHRNVSFAANPQEEFPDRTFSFETVPLEYPCFGISDYKSACLCVQMPDGTTATDVRYQGHRIYAGKPKLQGLPATYASEEEADSLEIDLKDSVSGAVVTLIYTAFRFHDAIARSCRVQNTSQGSLYLRRVLSACVDFDHHRYDMVNLYGKWARERQVERRRLAHGKQSIESLRGASSHQHNPFVAIAGPNTDEMNGEAYGFSLVYSGNFLAEVEVGQLDTARLVMGINPTDFTWKLGPGEAFTAPEVVMVYSQEGLGGMSRTFHRLYRNNLCRGPWKHKRRPILVNNWEATYFSFNEEKLLAIAQQAAQLGVEMFVMDDGWFGKRDSDKSGLGDWFVNEQKLRGGLKNLVDKVNALGMKFGIWFEPEMISEDSDLYRAHPDWCLHIPGRGRSLSRNQMVLDMSRQDVLDYLFQSMSAILSSANIEYVKWDMNRNLTEVSSRLLPADRQQETWHRYILGVYQLMERLLEAFPNLLLEGCAGGGGRFDPGLLYYAPQYWTSDDTDALERVKIQYGTSYVYPVSSMGAHVSVCPNEQTKRSVELQTRGYVAMAGTFGYELDLTKITQEEKDMMRRQIQQFKELHGVITYGDQYRLVDPFQDADMAAWMFVSEDKTEALVQVVQMRTDPNPPLRRIRLQGLDPSKRYREQDSGRILSGQAWMNAGINIPEMYGDGVACIFHLLALEL